MTILVTGASGFLGTALIKELLQKKHRVYGLSRHPPAAQDNLIPLVGDVRQTNLGLDHIPNDIHAVHHLAGLHSLGEDKDGEIMSTNVLGTRHVLDMCIQNEIPRLYFTSTAYTWRVNPYGRSKIINEQEIKGRGMLHGIKTTIFKPSIIMGTADQPYPGHFSQFVMLLIKIHQRAEIVRRKIEGGMRLPILEPVFRMKGSPSGTLNLIQVDAVAKAMTEIVSPGTYWLTHPNPPTLQQIVDWVGEYIMVNMKVARHFKPTPLEATLQKYVAAFQPYLYGDNFTSDLTGVPNIDREFIHDTIKHTFLG